MMDDKTDFKSERVNRAYILTTCGWQNGNCHSPFSILRESHKGVSHLSPWRSNPIGSSFSSFSILWEPILRPLRRCDNPYWLPTQRSWANTSDFATKLVVTLPSWRWSRLVIKSKATSHVASNVAASSRATQGICYGKFCFRCFPASFTSPIAFCFEPCHLIHALGGR